MAEGAVKRPSALTRERLRPVWTRAAALQVELSCLVLLVGGVLLWAGAIGTIDPRAMTDLGLVSVLPPSVYVALGLVTCSFMVLVHAHPRRSAILAGHVGALVLMLHATPTLVYGTLRYAWAWKHLGIVDFIQRHEAVDTHVASLDVYHSWPGFFALSAALQDLAGLDDLRAVAAWSPPVFTLLAVGAVMLIVSALTDDRRIVWLSAWTYVIVNWVGQEYFAPQALAFVLYLLALGIVLRWLGASPGRRLRPRSAGGRLVRPSAAACVAPGRARRAALVAVVLLLVGAITTTHLLTSVLTVLTLGALVLVGRCAVRTLPLLAAAIVATWWSTAARDYVAANVRASIDSIALPWVTTESNLVNAGGLSSGQSLVVAVGRLLTVAVLVLALLGVARLWRRRELDPAVLAGAAVPALLFATGDYDGELIFRIYLYASPFLAFLAVQAVVGMARRGPAWPAMRSAAMGIALLAGFLVAYYGKDRLYYFTPEEVAAAERVYRGAPDGALLIQGTRNVPVQFENYERLTYLTLSDESPDLQRRVIARPAATFADWIEDGGYRAGYVLITRSQKLEVADFGSLPRGSLERIEDALEASPRFTVVRGPDTTLAILVPERER